MTRERTYYFSIRTIDAPECSGELVDHSRMKKWLEDAISYDKDDANSPFHNYSDVIITPVTFTGRQPDDILQ